MNGYTWEDVSLIICGVLMEGSQPVAFDPNLLHPSVKEAIKSFLGQTSDPQTLDTFLQPDVAKRALAAYRRVDGLNIDWGSLLAVRYRDANFVLPALREAAAEIEGGREPNLWSILQTSITQTSGAQCLGEVEAIKDFYMRTGVSALDNFIGGIPREGVVAVFGQTGAGKTTFALALSLSFLKQYPDKRVLFLSYEHSAPILRALCDTRFPGDTEYLNRFFVIDNLRRGFRPIAAQAAFLSGSGVSSVYGLVVVDDVNGAAEEPSPQAHSAIWGELQSLARALKIPVVVLAQSNRTSTMGAGRYRFPSLHDIAWAGAAEQVSRLVIGIMRCNKAVQDAARSANATIYPVHPDGLYHHQLFFLKASYPSVVSNLRTPFCVIMDGDTNTEAAPWLGWRIYGNTAFMPLQEGDDENGFLSKNGNGKK